MHKCYLLLAFTLIFAVLVGREHLKGIAGSGTYRVRRDRRPRMFWFLAALSWLAILVALIVVLECVRYPELMPCKSLLAHVCR